MITPEMRKMIEGNALALATIDGKGNPHCIAVGDIKVVSENQILVGDNYMVETVKNIQQNANVALAVWNAGWKEDCIGYELNGSAKYFSSGKWCERIRKIHAGFPAKGAIVITVEKVKRLA